MKYLSSKLKPTTRRGYTLLFSVIVSVLVLSVAAFILSISRKQFILSSAARDSMYSFYAADSGIECAAEHYRDGDFDPVKIRGNTVGSVSCAGSSWTVIPSTSAVAPYTDTVPPTDQHATSTFFMPVGYNGSCAWVKVGFSGDGTATTTYIESRGYNIGYNDGATPPNCSIYGPRKVERALRLVYQ